MQVRDKDPSEDLAGWLKDVGRRTWHPSRQPGAGANDATNDSSDDLVRYLEELTGRKFTSRNDIRSYVDELAERERESSRIHARRQVVRDTVLLVCLLSAFIQYHFLDISLQISRLPSTVVFVPAQTGSAPARPSA